MKMENISTIRKCNGCEYRTMILSDNPEMEIECKHCSEGRLEVIAREN